VEPEPAAPEPTPAPAPAPETKSPRRAAVDPEALLLEARLQLAQREVVQARRSIDAALALALPAQARAEALSLRAECALVQGDRAAAAAAYLRVAKTFAQLPAGENALFAAARIQAERGERKAAADLLARYLERYPQGRFVLEASARLRALADESNLAR
jgi:hypothetical protein